MKSKLLLTAAALGIVIASVAVAPSAGVAAPLNAGHAETLKSAAPGEAIEVRRRGRYWAYGLGGVALGAALAAPYYYNRPYYNGGYYAYGPAQQCWVQTGPYRGQGYWGYC